MSTAADWLSKFRYSSSSEVADENPYRTWGFTIYHTSYGPSADHQWQRLLQTNQTRAYEKALKVTGATEDDPGFQQIWSLLRIDARSDTALAGLDMDQLRLLYNNGDGGPPMNTDLRSHRAFLVADDEILPFVDGSVVKFADAEYLAEDHIPWNRRLGGQRYFGWMPMKAACVVELWKHLEDFDLQKLAPETIGGSHLVILEDDYF